MNVIEYGKQNSDIIMLLHGGGLSLGAQVLTEMLSQREDICRYAIVESASVIPSRITNALIEPAFASSYGLIRRKRFAKMQFQYLRIRDELFEEYYRDTAKINKSNVIAFLKANTTRVELVI